MVSKHMKILGLETTCDETGAAVVEGELGSKHGVKLLSNVVATSAELQKKYGGVVPEVAAREQVRVIMPIITEAIFNASETLNSKLENLNKLQNPQISKWVRENIDAIAVAHGPGLIGSLLIGVETAKTLALAWEKPLIAVNHLVGHIYANWLNQDVDRGSYIVHREKKRPHERLTMNDKPAFPLVALIVSGGHTDLVLMKKHGDYKLLGSTLDDAAGEAFDKVAKVLGLGYPGGPEIERKARQGTRDRGQGTLNFPRPLINSNDFNFSFSGLKTAVVNRAQELESKRVIDKAEIAFEFQQAVVDVLVTKTIRAAQKFGVKSIVVGGGVAANNSLRSQLTVYSSRIGVPVFFPERALSVDNGAMIAAAAFYNFKKIDPLKLSADPSLHFP